MNGLTCSADTEQLTFHTGEVLISQGERCCCIYRVVSGTVCAHAKSEGALYTHCSATVQRYGYESFQAGAGFNLCAEEYTEGTEVKKRLLDSVGEGGMI